MSKQQDLVIEPDKVWPVGGISFKKIYVEPTWSKSPRIHVVQRPEIDPTEEPMWQNN